MIHDKNLYEYAVIRVVPRVEREEFVNVGLILFSKKQKYLKASYKINDFKLRLFCPDLDLEQIRENLESFVRISQALHDAGPIAKLEVAERFRWLTAVRSSVLQTSRPQTGYSDDFDATFEKLFVELVD